ncbi:MAG: hypothetical protein M3O61_12015 [Gemmatimonadota bacterium]|nr:hypothetical protein [Gemmatimonadota bacterium]
MSKALAAAIKGHKVETEAVIRAAPDWATGTNAFEKLFRKMSDPKDSLWSATFIDKLSRTYLDARDTDKTCANITVRTVNAMGKRESNDTKKVMLQIANGCRVFNAAHKVNFDEAELPEGFSEIPMTASKKKGVFTYAEAVASLYPKTSLTFDYWVPRIFELTREVREKRIKDWKGEASSALESCTDFMRICLIFLSDPAKSIPIAKAEDREAFLSLFGQEFTWLRKSAKREDVTANSNRIKAGLREVSSETGMAIPFEAWSRLQYAPFIKPVIK